jgi:hypothetical protein
MPRSTGNCFRRYNATEPAARHTTTNSQEAEKPQQPKSNHRAKVDPPNTASNGVLEGTAQKIPITTPQISSHTRAASHRISRAPNKQKVRLQKSRTRPATQSRRELTQRRAQPGRSTPHRRKPEQPRARRNGERAVDQSKREKLAEGKSSGGGEQVKAPAFLERKKHGRHPTTPQRRAEIAGRRTEKPRRAEPPPSTPLWRLLSSTRAARHPIRAGSWPGGLLDFWALKRPIRSGQFLFFFFFSRNFTQFKFDSNSNSNFKGKTSSNSNTYNLE